ncbi:MAG TPA: hypothetical protein VGR06_17130 [Actinophytocola sp.]|jgi:hypothetical protein|uniref:hypothetical protein n=1 Tax=Actinophytocola sp. TaxID=1872138 RepID=UPI002E03BFDB|nr:hypothetical protein [Actinophytocola sp.]
MDTTGLRAAYADFLAVAEAGGFGPPPPGEWDADHILAHIYAGHAQITSIALAVAAGLRPPYDNRPGLDGWNLQRVIDQAGDRAGLIRLIRQGEELHLAVTEHLTKADLEVQVPVLIISNDEVVVDEPWPLAQLVFGIGMVHLPRHADQLRSLLPAN